MIVFINYFVKTDSFYPGILFIYTWWVVTIVCMTGLESHRRLVRHASGVLVKAFQRGMSGEDRVSVNGTLPRLESGQNKGEASRKSSGCAASFLSAWHRLKSPKMREP